MAITSEQAVEKARRLALEKGIALDPSDIYESIGYALEDVGRFIADGSEYQLQQKDYSSITLTSGVASLSSITDMLIDTIEMVKHPDIDGSGTDQYFYRIPNGTEQDLATHADTMNPVYIIESNSLKLSLGNGTFPASDDLPPNTSALVVRANFIPAISTIHARFEDKFIEFLVMQSQMRKAA
jgi:hypothetical protein